MQILGLEWRCVALNPSHRPFRPVWPRARLRTIRTVVLTVGGLAGGACGRTLVPGQGEGTRTDSGPTGTDTDGGETRGAFPDPSTGGGASDSGGDVTTDTGPPKTSDTSDTSDTDTGPRLDVGGPISCREIVVCSLECLTQFDLDCVIACGEGAAPEESRAAQDLIQCVVTGCLATGACDLTGGAVSEDCLVCVGFGLFAPAPAGCETQAAACR